MRGPRRNRLAWLGMIALVIGLGLGSRRYRAELPGIVAAYAGDTLWATAAFLGFGLLLPTASTAWAAALAMGASVLVEVSQLARPPWLEAIRRTTIGGLVLGYDFVWSDLACYAVGVGIGAVGEGWWFSTRRHPIERRGPRGEPEP